MVLDMGSAARIGRFSVSGQSAESGVSGVSSSFRDDTMTVSGVCFTGLVEGTD